MQEKQWHLESFPIPSATLREFGTGLAEIWIFFSILPFQQNMIQDGTYSNSCIVLTYPIEDFNNMWPLGSTVMLWSHIMVRIYTHVLNFQYDDDSPLFRNIAAFSSPADNNEYAQWSEISLDYWVTHSTGDVTWHSTSRLHIAKTCWCSTFTYIVRWIGWMPLEKWIEIMNSWEARFTFF